MVVQVQGEKCQYDGCKEDATTVAYGRGRGGYGHTGYKGIGVYCNFHADQVAEEGSPEYHVDCPNCGCLFGVN